MIDPADTKPATEATAEVAPTPKPKKPKRQLSRIDRWNDAANKAEAVVAELRAQFTALEYAFSVLDELRQEYQEWRDNLPENLSSRTLADKLNEVADMDFASAKDELDNALSSLEDVTSTATGLDLPRGFGKD